MSVKIIRLTLFLIILIGITPAVHGVDFLVGATGTRKSFQITRDNKKTENSCSRCEGELWGDFEALPGVRIDFGRDLIEGWDYGFNLGYSQFEMNKQRTDIKVTNSSDNSTKSEILYLDLGTSAQGNFTYLLLNVHYIMEVS